MWSLIEKWLLLPSTVAIASALESRLPSVTHNDYSEFRVTPRTIALHSMWIDVSSAYVPSEYIPRWYDPSKTYLLPTEWGQNIFLGTVDEP